MGHKPPLKNHCLLSVIRELSRSLISDLTSEVRPTTTITRFMIVEPGYPENVEIILGRVYKLWP